MNKRTFFNAIALVIILAIASLCLLLIMYLPVFSIVSAFSDFSIGGPDVQEQEAETFDSLSLNGTSNEETSQPEHIENKQDSK